MKLTTCLLPGFALFVGLPDVAVSQALGAPAQLRVIVQPNGAPVVEVVPSQATEAAAATATTVTVPAAASADTTVNAKSDTATAKQRTAVIDKLTFDRRPSAILKAWQDPDGSKEQALKAKEAVAREEAPKIADESKAAEANPDEQPEVLTDEQQAAKTAAEAAAEKTKRDAEELKQQMDEFNVGIAQLKRDVTLGRWEQVGAFIAGLEDTEGKTVYQKLLQSLVAGPPDQARNRQRQPVGEQNVFRAADVVALGEICPVDELEDAHIASLGQVANLCQAEGQAEYIFVDVLKRHVAESGDDRKITERVAARILFAAKRIEDSRAFLPTVDKAVEDDDTEALGVLTDIFFQLYAKEGDKGLLEQSWQAAQALLAYGDTEDALRQKAMKRCVQLVPMVREELGQQWLTDSFTSEPERGMAILSGIGSAAATAMKDYGADTGERLGTLKLQQTAVDALLRIAPEKAESWSDTLHLLAANWLREATYSRMYDSSTQRGPSMERDTYGNYYWNSNASRTALPQGMPQPVPAGNVLDVRPDDSWLKFLHDGYRSRFAVETARLHLRVKEEAEAFPYIERLAATHKEDARELVQEFLDVWAENHDPNTQTRRTSIYMFSYGYSQRASGIPLTRSRQERNLTELVGWVDRIRRLPIDNIDEKWISAAFVRVHSSAEVYRLDDMQRVFGNIDGMEPDTLAALLQTMRGNLAGIWRKPEVQQQANTNRKKQEIEAEVVQGYAAARKLCDDAVADHPDSWKLQLVRATLLHDENDYRAELENNSNYADVRKTALEEFRSAAETYIAGIPELKETEYTVEPFNHWFYAALGASDIDQITQAKVPLLGEMEQLHKALESVTPESFEKHLAMFANDLFTRMSRVNPAVKFRYVREGLKIVGDHEQAREARKVFDYYNDLVTEIKLETEVDGTPKIGHEQPFGLFVGLRHTKAIERESGGFSRYLQNQNAGNSYFYNSGRPTENYRDKFEQAARDVLDEHFEVLSVTFQPETVESKATADPGWRKTSYAYLLLKPRGPEIDRVPPLKLDLDFLDTTGYAVLPVESQALSVNCSMPVGDPRPVEKLSIAQTLDERQADEGKLLLEIKATAQGLVPDLGELVDLTLTDFEVTSVEDNGLSVSRFDPEASDPVVVSDRLWTVTLQDARTDAANARSFTFPAALAEPEELVFQRYDDADLVSVEPTITLEEKYDEASIWPTVFAVIAGVLLFTSTVTVLIVRKRKPKTTLAAARWQVPENPTPFTVLTLLKDIERNNGFAAEHKQELATSINRIERYYFAEETNDQSPDLHTVAANWVRRAK